MQSFVTSLTVVRSGWVLVAANLLALTRSVLLAIRTYDEVGIQSPSVGDGAVP